MLKITPLNFKELCCLFVSGYRDKTVKTMPIENRRPDGGVKRRSEAVVAIGDKHGWFEKGKKENPRTCYQRSHNQRLF